MIITRTPYRISFFGGSTDYPAYYREHGGCVLGTTIDKYCYLFLRRLPPFFEHKHRIVWSEIELVGDIGEIHHPLVRETYRMMGVADGLELHHEGDLPARTGLGTSSAFTVGLLQCLYALKGQMPAKMQLAKDAIHIEQDALAQNVGCQDQVWAAFGGFNRIDFMPDDSIIVNPVILKAERVKELESHLMLLFTGFARNASDVAAEQVRETPNHHSELSEMCDMVHCGQYILTSQTDIREFGKMLNRSWQIKRRLSTAISNDSIDALYSKALENGADGGKLLGAGGGGFLLIFARPEVQPQIKETLGLLHVPFHFERGGAQVIVYDP